MTIEPGALPCTGGCGCFTKRFIDGIEPGSQVAFCVWCEDGENCPNGTAAAPEKFNSAFLDRRMEEHKRAGGAAPPKVKKQPVAPAAPARVETRQQVETKQCAGFEGKPCTRPIGPRSTTGLCNTCNIRRNYRLKHPQKVAGGGRAKVSKVARTIAAKPITAKVSVDLSEALLDKLLCSLPLDEKARLLSESFAD